ncbi:hypothetical protein EMPS_05650 [Entomortierella parvispora]|uniref:NYN domain-containing protein n=1 Tax=Entomortierella parvispora TaxID=205924 RepID=A0A9P3HBH9_9FUNG|nr:hypothetical protein EMPS_05650 [Entomortierella parvispora]
MSDLAEASNMPDQEAIVPEADGSLLGDLDQVLGFLADERREQNMDTSSSLRKQYDTSAALAAFGDLSDVMQYLNSERLRSLNSKLSLQEQLAGNTLPSNMLTTAIVSSTLSIPTPDIANDVERAANTPPNEVETQSPAQTAPVCERPQIEPTTRKRAKSSSPKHQLSIDDPSSSSAGSASSESDSKTKVAIPMEISRPKRYWPLPAGRALRDMKRMALSEQLGSSASSVTIPTVKVTVKSGAFPRSEAVVAEGPRCNYDNFWNTGSEYCAVVPVDTTDSEDTTPSHTKKILAMRTRDSFLYPRGQALLAKALNTPTFTTDSVASTAPSQSAKDQSKEMQPSERNSQPASKRLGRATATAQIMEAIEPPKKVFIFVDNSNILFGYYQYYQKMTSAEKAVFRHAPTPRQNQSKGLSRHRLPLFNYDAFFRFLQRQREVERRVLVGSAPLYQELDEALTHVYETIILRRVRKFAQGELGSLPVPCKARDFSESSSMGNPNPSGVPGSKDSESHVVPLISTTSTTREQGVDEMIHLKMMETIIDYPVPGIMVLASGDGGDSEFGGGGFSAVVKRALERGWQVEIVSWEDQLSCAYVDLANEYGYNFVDDGLGHLRVLCLDWFAELFAAP